MTELLSSLESPSDAELIARVRGGDLAAYGDLFERHVHAARRLARQLVRGPDSDDLVSDAFTKVMRVLQSGGGPDVAFRAYLLTAVRRLHVDKVRAAAKLTTTDDLTPFDPGVPFQDTAIEGFESGAAAKAFASLPERWQMVLWHLEVEGQKPADVAPLLGMSANSVSALAYRAREGLRQAFLTAHLNDADEEVCRWTTEHLGAFVRKGLSKRDSAKVQDHLDQCRQCTAMYLELNEVNNNLSAIIAPLLLGAAAAGYVSSGAGFMSGVVVLLDRAKDAVIGHTVAATATGVAASAAAATAVAIVVGGGSTPIQNVQPQPSPTVVVTSPAPTSLPTTPAPTTTRTPKPEPTFPVVEIPPIAFQPSADVRITSTTISDNALVLDLAGLPQDSVVVNVDMSSSSGKTSFQPAKDQCTVTTEQPRHAECVSGSKGGASTWLMAPSELQLVIPLRFPEDMVSDQLYFLVTLDGYSDPDGSDNTVALTFTPHGQPTGTPSPSETPSPSQSPSPTPSGSPSPTFPPTPTIVNADMALSLSALDDHHVKATVSGLPLITLNLAFVVDSDFARMTEVPVGCLMVSDTQASCLITITNGHYDGVFTFKYPPGQAPVDVSMTVSALLINDTEPANNTATISIGEHPGNNQDDTTAADMGLSLKELDDHHVKATVSGLPLITLNLAFVVDSDFARMTEVPVGCLMVSDTQASCLITITNGHYDGVFTFKYPPGQAPVDVSMTVSALLINDTEPANNTATISIGEHPGNSGDNQDDTTPTPTLTPSASPSPEGLLRSLLSPKRHHHHTDQPSADPTSTGGLLGTVSGLLGALL